MNETYVECMVAHKKSPLAGAFKYIMYALAILCFLSGVVLSPLGIILAIVLGLVGYIVSPMLDIEYEYLYLDKSISIDKVMAKEKRKHITDIDLNTMEIMAPLSSHELDSYKAQKLPYKEYASGLNDSKVYVIMYIEKENKQMVGIEPNEEMLKAIKTYFPRKVVEN